MRILSIVSGPRARLLVHAAARLLPTVEIAEIDAGLANATAADGAIFDGDPATVRRLASTLGGLCTAAWWIPPLAGGEREERGLVRLAKRHRLRLAPLQTARYHPGLAAVMEVFASGALGPLTAAAYARNGHWPMFPDRANLETAAADAYWDAIVLAPFTSQTSGVNKLYRVDDEVDFCFTLSLVGAHGTLDHRQSWRCGDACESRLETRFKASGGRQWDRRFAVALPLACELATCLGSIGKSVGKVF